METVCVRIKRKTVAGAKNNKGKIHGSTVIFTTQKIVLLTHTTPVHTHKIVQFDVVVEKPAAKYSQIS